MRRYITAALTLGCCLTGCATDTPEPQVGQTAPPILTAEAAEAGLIKLVKSPEPGQLKGFPLERFAKQNIVVADGGSPSWGPFSLAPSGIYLQVFYLLSGAPRRDSVTCDLRRNQHDPTRVLYPTRECLAKARKRK